MSYTDFVCLCALIPLIGCSETSGAGFPCTEQGIRDAIAEGGGPHTFGCDGPTTVFTTSAMVIDGDVVLDGEGKLTVDGPEELYTFHVANPAVAELRGFSLTGACTSIFIQDGAALTLSDSTVTGNIVARDGHDCSAVRNAGMTTVTNCTVTGNGVGIDNSDGHVTITNSLVSENSRGGIVNGGGSLFLTNSTVSGNERHHGGGIDNSATSDLWSYARLENSTVSGNVATQSSGGGIFNGIANAELLLVNTTVSNNSAKEAGGGIASGYAATLISSTIASNTAPQGSGIAFGGGAVPPTETIAIRATLVEGECFTTAAIVSEGHNIESPGDTCGFGEATDQVNVTPGDLDLGPLLENGGPTMTHGLLPGSIAVDVIPEAACLDQAGEPLTDDQRGETRPQGDACDIGAFELRRAPGE